MRICDRCGEKNVSEKLVSQIDGAEIDLCRECKEDFQKFVSDDTQEVHRKRGRPKKSA